MTYQLSPEHRASAIAVDDDLRASTCWWWVAASSVSVRRWTPRPAGCRSACWSSATSPPAPAALLQAVHGGLRYLEMLDFALVREALAERGLLLTRLAPHLVRPVPFLYPLKHAWERPYVGAGRRALRHHGDDGHARTTWVCPSTSTSSASSSRGWPPTSGPTTCTGAIRYYDCQVDDARLVMTIARTAANNGAHVATRTKVTGFLRDGERVVGVTAHDLETDAEVTIRARTVINAAGVWTDQVQEVLGGQARLDVDASKGVHLVVPKDRIRSECGFITKTEKSVLFVIPWDDFWIIGTTDTPWGILDLAHPAASKADIDYILGHVNRLLKDPLDHRDVVGVYAGLRPLLKAVKKQGEGNGGETTKLSREHTVANPVPGLVLIAGGKLTTYRVMAKDAVDHAIRDWVARPPSITERVPLLGAYAHEARTNQRVALSRGVRPRGRRHRPPARALRRPDRRGARPDPCPARARRGAQRCGALPRGRGRLRRHPRGCAAPRRRADPAYARVDRDLRPWGEGRQAGGRG